MLKIIFRLSLLVGAAGLVLIVGETYRKSNHRDKVLHEMSVTIEAVNKAPKTTPVLDENGIPIQSEADVQALTASFRMNCFANVVNSNWKVSTMCEPIVVSLLADPFDKTDLSFQPKRRFILWGIFLALTPLYFLAVRYLVSLFAGLFKKKKPADP